MSDREISQRKVQHIDIARQDDTRFRSTTTLLEGVQLVHEALPELSLDEIDTSVVVLGKRLRAPIIIAAMTGGSPRSRNINRELASIAQERGYGFGLGSQRPMLQHPELTDTYAVREVAPDVLLLGNLGVIQARERKSEELAAMVEAVGADALCIHLNPAMEVVQPEGDRDFRGGLETIARLVKELPVPVMAKETGCGISYATARRLKSVGIDAVDVSGAGGTSWVAVEMKRATGENQALGEVFREWGIPTGASVALTRAAGIGTIIATGGMVNGLDIARAMVLGASAGGLARVVINALEESGRSGAMGLLDRVERELRTAMLLVGARDLAALARVPRMLSLELQRWLETAR